MWRVMATAPRDGTPILSYGWQGGTLLYRYRVTHWEQDAWTDWGTHTPAWWMALPSPPDKSLGWG